MYVYVVDRDFGFAPNPFHGVLTLATCKAPLRRQAQVNDWVIGMGGGRLGATGRCVFAMKVTRRLTFNEYWVGHEFRCKRPARNGSRKMLVGDNIYFRNGTGEWAQADSHHSNDDGTPNPETRGKDTKADVVLVSTHFLYFGRSAPVVPTTLLQDLGYKNQRFYRRYRGGECEALIGWLEKDSGGRLNRVMDDPFDFSQSHKRFDGKKVR